MSDAGGQSDHRVRLGDLEMWFELSIEILESLSYSIQSEDSPLFSGIIDHSLLLRMDDLTGRFESVGFSQILKDLKTVNEQHISSGQHATRVEGTTYCLAAEALQALLKAVHSKLVLISERLDSGAVRYHISGLSSIGINEPVLEELRELFYQQVSSYWRREDLDRQEKFDSLSKDIELLTEKFKAGAERGQVLKWTDAEEAVNMTKADYEFPESLNQEVIDERERDSEYARLSRINKAQIEVSTFTKEDPHQDFYRGFSQRIAALGQVLKAEKVARHLDSIQSDWPKQWQKDAFQHAVQIYQTAVSGDAEEVIERLESLSQATESGDERSQKAKREFRDFVYLALRHEVMLKLRKKEFCSPQNLTQSTLNAHNAERNDQISGDHSDLEPIGGSSIRETSPLVLPEIDNAQSLAELDQKEDLKRRKKKQQPWCHSPLDKVPDSHRDKNGNPIGGLRGTQQRLAYAVSEDAKTFKRRAQRGSIFVFEHKKGDYEMFIHHTEIGKLEEFRKRFEEFPAKKAQSNSKKKNIDGSKRD